MYVVDMVSSGRYAMFKTTNKKKPMFESKGESLETFWGFVMSWAINTMGASSTGLVKATDAIKLLLLLNHQLPVRHKPGTTEFIHAQDFNQWANEARTNV